jgi:hypothetical protein
MNGKLQDSTSTNPAETEDLRLAVRELNESIAYLSKMVLQLQRSMTNKNGREERPNIKPDIIH